MPLNDLSKNSDSSLKQNAQLEHHCLDTLIVFNTFVTPKSKRRVLTTSRVLASPGLGQLVVCVGPKLGSLKLPGLPFWTPKIGRGPSVSVLGATRFVLLVLKGNQKNTILLQGPLKTKKHPYVDVGHLYKHTHRK